MTKKNEQTIEQWKREKKITKYVRVTMVSVLSIIVILLNIFCLYYVVFNGIIWRFLVHLFVTDVIFVGLLGILWNTFKNQEELYDIAITAKSREKD